MKNFKLLVISLISLLFIGCDTPLNSPYQTTDNNESILYSYFSERPKHLDPAVAYSSNEYTFIGQIYEPPFQYHYLKRPYELVPLTATKMPEIHFLDKQGKRLADDAAIEAIAFSEYLIEIKQGIHYQPHPAFVKNDQGTLAYQQLSADEMESIHTLADFSKTSSRELIAADYVHQIKRLVHPKVHSPISELMKPYIVGLADFSKQLNDKKLTEINHSAIEGVQVIDRYRYKIRIHGKYPQFIFWLAMPFFAPMPWEADVFYAQQLLKDKNISLDWYPIGTGAYLLAENNPNRQMVMLKNPNFHGEAYPSEGELGDKEKGLLKDAGKPLPFIDKVVYVLEKETIPYWNKFLQGYYDASGIASDSFDQAVQFTGQGGVELTPDLLVKNIQLQTAVMASISYMGFNMLDDVVGGQSEAARKLRLAISIAIDYEEYISIFMNGRGIAAQGILPPSIYGYQQGEQGINPYIYDWKQGKAQRKPISAAKQLMTEAGYQNGLDQKTGEALIIYLDTPASGPDERARLNWFRKQLDKIGIQLVIRATDYNRFQQKMRDGNAQLFMWGWNADYPDPENFFFLLYGKHGKALHGGENAGNYDNAKFNRLFEKMRNLDNSEQRFQIITQLQEIIRHDAPWIFGVNPKAFSLYHQWYGNLKPNLMANNRLKYGKIDAKIRENSRNNWNQPLFLPLIIAVIILIVACVPAVRSYRQRTQLKIK